MRYMIMRLFLARRYEGTLLEALPERQTRQEFIQEAFGSEIRFEHYGNSFVFAPFPSPDTTKIVGVVGKQDSISILGPPEEKFLHHEVANWNTANILIDTATGPEGQKIAMQSAALGSPLAILRSLASHINDEAKPTSDWRMTINPITTREEFWAVAERYRGHISEIDFQFAVPNIWGGKSETEKALRELKDENNAQEVEVKIKNRDGKLDPDSTRIRESVDYVSKGGGTAQLRDDTQSQIYSSDSEEQIVSVSVDDDPPIQESNFDAIIVLILKLFGIRR